MRPDKRYSSVKQAKRFRRELTKPELMLWQLLRLSPGGHKFRKQHPAGPYVLDFFCARANLAIEVDGIAHDMGCNAERDAKRDRWLEQHRIGTLRIPAAEILRNTAVVGDAIIATVEHRLDIFGKAPPSSLRDATSPSQVDGED